MSNVRGFKDLNKDDDDDHTRGAAAGPGGVSHASSGSGGRYVPKAPRGGGGGGGGAGVVIEVEDESEFNAHVHSGMPLVADFYATWCGPCRAIHPAVQRLAAENPQVRFVRVDVDRHARLARECNVEAMPTFLFFANGQLIDTMKGANEARLRELVAKLGASPVSSAGGSSGGGYRLGTRDETLQSQPPPEAASGGDAPSGGDALSGELDSLLQLFVPQLTMMGFTEAQARTAVRKCGGKSLDAALDYLETLGGDGEDADMTGGEPDAKKPKPEEQQQAGDHDMSKDDGGQVAASVGDGVPGMILHNALCNDCKEQIVGVRYKCDQCSDFDLCEQHHAAKTHDAEHTFTAHSKDIENPEKKPLTAAELAERKRDLQERLLRVRAQKAREAEQNAIEQEKRRVSMAKDAQKAATSWKEKQAERDLFLAKKEKEAQQAAKEKILKKIAQDKLERQAAARKKKGLAAEASAPASPQSQPASATGKNAGPSVAATYSSCKIQVRLPDGKRLVKEFEPDDTVAAVERWVSDEAGLSDVTLSTTYPRRVFGHSEAQIVTLRQADCVPRGQFVVVP